MYRYKSTGEDVYFDIQVTNDDPTSSAGRQTVILKDCNIDGGVLARFDADDDYLDEELSFTFEAVSYTHLFRERGPLASACLAARGVPVKNTEASLVFNRDTIVNESQVIADVAGSADLLSRETLLEQHPWVEDVQRELGRLRREQAVSDSEKGEAT